MELQMCLKLLRPTLLLLLAFGLVAHGQSFGLSITFRRLPPNVSSARTATFVFLLRDSRGRDPCGNCSIKCKLDAQRFTDCSSRSISYSTLIDGEHTFEVSVNTSSTAHSARYSWIVDTVPPTASVFAGSAFTNAANVSVDISFSEPCTGEGGFRCSGASACNLLVYGSGHVIPSTLKVVQSDMKYNVIVVLSARVQYGKVILVMDRSFCTDSAGNRFQRTENSSVIIRFDRRNVLANLWTKVPKMQLEINNESRTVEATNNTEALEVYLDFTAPVLNSSVEMLKVLQTTAGVLLPTQRRSHGHRRFGYMLRNLSSVAVVNINLETSSIISRQGTPVSPTNSVTFLYDSKRPTVKLSTALTTKTRERNVPVLIQFVKPIFHFNTSAISISGGHLKSFREVTKSAYIMEVNIDDVVVSINVPENRTVDIAGNLNLPSNLLQVRHYTVPALSVALHTFATAALLATSVAATALTISTASLESAGGLSSHAARLIVADPSRNLLSMICHLQVYALSKWLAVSLPVEYYETARGLQWLIPHLGLPWEKSHKHSVLVDSSIPITIYHNTMHQKILGCALPRQPQGVLGNHNPGLFLENRHPGVHKPGTNSSIFGPALGPMEYGLFFEGQGTKPVAESILKNRNFDGWKEFERNMFWLAVIGGGLLLCHVLILLLLHWRRWRWRTGRHNNSGALVIPRFEMFLVILALPCMCQAAAFLIRGRLMAGTIIGALLLSIPSDILVSVFLFVSVAVTLGLLLQYKEVHQESWEIRWYQGIMKMLIGPCKRAEWAHRNDSTSSFVMRFGLFFEALRGPPKVLLSQIEGESSKTGRNGILTSDDEMGDAAAPIIQKLFRNLRVSYVILDLSKRVALGIVAGAYPTSDSSWSQISIVFCFTVFQLFFLVVIKPYIRRGVQIVEIISASCEAGLFGSCLVLLAKDHSSFDHRNVGFLMITLFLVSFLAQMIYEWYAFIIQLLSLPPDASFASGMKMMVCGLLMIVTPRRLWHDYPWIFPLSAKERESTTTEQNQLPRKKEAADIGSIKGEDKVFDGMYSTSFEEAKPVEGRWPKILCPKSKSNEFEMLRELAKASFPRTSKGSDSSELDPSCASSRIKDQKEDGSIRVNPNSSSNRSLRDSFIQLSIREGESSVSDSRASRSSRSTSLERELENIFSFK